MPQSLRKRTPPQTRSSRVPLALGAAVVAVGAVVAVALFFAHRPEPSPSQPTERSAELVSTERELYAAMDSKDPGKQEEAFAKLMSPDAGVRLAALRYLCASEKAADSRLHALLDDDVDRIRRAAVQLLGANCADVPALADRLRSIAGDPKRDMAERHLARQALDSAR